MHAGRNRDGAAAFPRRVGRRPALPHSEGATVFFFFRTADFRRRIPMFAAPLNTLTHTRSHPSLFSLFVSRRAWGASPTGTRTLCGAIPCSPPRGRRRRTNSARSRAASRSSTPWPFNCCGRVAFCCCRFSLALPHLPLPRSRAAFRSSTPSRCNFCGHVAFFLFPLLLPHFFFSPLSLTIKHHHQIK